MAIPIIYIWAGRFPAILSSTVISWMIAYTVLSYMIKCYVRPGRNIIHDFRSAAVSVNATTCLLAAANKADNGSCCLSLLFCAVH